MNKMIIENIISIESININKLSTVFQDLKEFILQKIIGQSVSLLRRHINKNSFPLTTFFLIDSNLLSK